MRSIHLLNANLMNGVVSCGRSRSLVTALLLVSMFLVLVLTVRSAHADMGMEPGSGNMEKPRVYDVDVFFDGIDQYAIYGSVGNCGRLDGVLITLGGVLRGATEMTDEFGNFHYLGIVADGSGMELAITATSHAGIKSDVCYVRLP